PIDSFDEIRERVLPYPGREMTVDLLRDGKEIGFTLTIGERIERDRFGNEARLGSLGVAAAEVDIVKVGPGEAVVLGVDQSIDIVRMMVTGIAQIFTGERSVKELGGPIKIAKYSGEQFSLGWPEFVYFVALISINLAFINLLPI